MASSLAELGVSHLTTIFRHSIAMMKRNGGRGSPCRTPFDIENSSMGEPLTNTKACEDESHPNIQCLHLIPKFI